VRALPPGTQYFNAGSFGLKINQTRKLAGVLVSRERPKVVLLVCGPMDFYHDFQMPVTMDDSELDRFIAGGWYPLFVSRHFDFRYYVTSAREVRRLRSSRTEYMSLDFDAWGGLALDIHYPHVDGVRWNTVFQPDLLGS